MSKLPAISGQACCKALKHAGFYERRRESSHIVLRRDDPYAQAVVPDHRELDKGTLRSIPKGAGISIEEFVRLTNL